VGAKNKTIGVKKPEKVELPYPQGAHKPVETKAVGWRGSRLMGGKRKTERKAEQHDRAA